MQKSASIQKSTSPLKFDHLAETYRILLYRIFQHRSAPSRACATTTSPRCARSPSSSCSTPARSAASSLVRAHVCVSAALGKWASLMKSRRAAAGRAQLLANMGHTGRVQNSENFETHAPIVSRPSGMPGLPQNSAQCLCVSFLGRQVCRRTRISSAVRYAGVPVVSRPSGMPAYP